MGSDQLFLLHCTLPYLDCNENLGNLKGKPLQACGGTQVLKAQFGFTSRIQAHTGCQGLWISNKRERI